MFKAKPAMVMFVPDIVRHKVDWDKLVSLDFETYYDTEYTLSKLSTSEYVRDPRFKPLMVGVKIGRRATVVIPAPKIAAYLKRIDWKTHSLLCHNTQFDGFILSQRYGIVPKHYYCTLSMARGLHSNEIGAGLDEVAVFYGGKGKIKGALENAAGLTYEQLVAKKLYDPTAEYCARDVDEMLDIFKKMIEVMPASEVDLIHLVTRMFCDPVLLVDIPRVQAELKRELDRREKLFYDAVNPADYASERNKLLKTKAERLLPQKKAELLMIKRVIGSNERFVELLRAEGVEPPMKLSKAWMNKPPSERRDEDKWTYAFAKDDLEFVNLPDDVDVLGVGLNLNKKADVAKLAARQARLRTLVDVRLAVKSTTNITRAQRFLTAGANGAKLPVGYAYYRAHTGRLGGNNKMNMQNLTRGGELRLSILAAPGHVLVVNDSGQIEARVNAWLWGQTDLLDAFRVADAYDAEMAKLPKDQRREPAVNERDAYCRFGDNVYGRVITKKDKTERFVGKVCVLGLGFQMGAAKLQMTLAKGALGGPPVYFTLDECKKIINTYRAKNHAIANGWKICERIIDDMAHGRQGSYKCLSWGKEFILLPNGMKLKYPDLRKSKNEDNGWDEWSYRSGDMRKKIYGGLLCENIVQALARIIVMSQTLEIDKKYRVVMSTHDEAVTHVLRRSGEAALRYMHKVMTTPPAWCQDIPLASEGGWDVNYSK